eukprot:10654731-Lingulodinium_polyedra.AAC.1
MDRACYDAKCLPPFPGPVDTSTTLLILTRLGWQMFEQMVDRPHAASGARRGQRMAHLVVGV